MTAQARISWTAWSNRGPFIDPSGHTIQLSGTADEKLLMLENLQRITNYELRVDKNGYVWMNLDVWFLWKEDNYAWYSSGDDLIYRLIASANTCAIQIRTGRGSSETPDNWTNGTNGVGTNCTVFFNPTNDSYVLAVDPASGVAKAEKRPSYIGLAHELVHAERDMRGGAYDYSIKVDFTYKAHRNRDPVSLLWVYEYRTLLIAKEELATVGLGGYNNKYDITENMIRAEHGLNPRGVY